LPTQDGVIGSEVRKNCGDWNEKFAQVLDVFSDDDFERPVDGDGGQRSCEERPLSDGLT